MRRKPKTPEQRAMRLAKRLTTEAQAKRGGFVVVGISNHSEADQRHMVRSKETETIRRLTRIERLERSGTISSDEAAACQWYANAFELGYATLGIVASYGTTGGGGCSAYTHLSRYKAQQEARADYLFAREAVPPFLLPMFEKVVLNGLTMIDAGEELYAGLSRSQRSDKLASAFRMAANLLHGRIAHMLPAR